MIARMCRFYGFSDEHCLQMPAPRFFLLLEQIDRIQGKEYVDQCYVSRASSMTNDAFKSTVEYFSALGEKATRPENIDMKKYKEIQVQSHLKATDPTVQGAVMGLFAMDGKINRKVVVNPKKPKSERWRVN